MLLRIMNPYFCIFPFIKGIHSQTKLECQKKNEPPVQGAKAGKIKMCFQIICIQNV